MQLEALPTVTSNHPVALAPETEVHCHTGLALTHALGLHIQPENMVAPNRLCISRLQPDRSML